MSLPKSEKDIMRDAKVEELKRRTLEKAGLDKVTEKIVEDSEIKKIKKIGR